MNSRNSKGFLGNPFLIALNSSLKEEEIANIIASTKNEVYYINSYSLYSRIRHYMVDKKLLKNDNNQNYESIISNVVTKNAIQNGFLDLIDYSEQDKIKINSLINKKQFNSKILVKVSQQLSYFISEVLSQNDYTNSNIIYNLFLLDILNAIEEYDKELIIKEYGDFKSKIDKITSGVKNECYFNLYGNGSLNHNLAKYILDKHGYNLNSDHFISTMYYLYYNESFSEILCQYLTDNEKMIKNFSQFLEKVCIYNDENHAFKIIDYCFEQFKNENELTKFIYENKFPLVYKDDFIKKMIEHAQYWLSERLFDDNYCALSYEDAKGLLYPIFKDFDKEIKKGKSIFESFIKEAYCENCDKVLELFNNPNTIIQEQSNNKRKLSIIQLTDALLFGYNDESNDAKFAYKYFDNFSDDKSALSRFYYLCYLIKKYIPDNYNESIYEYTYDLLNIIDTYLNISCKYGMDEEARNKSYNELKLILSNFDINIDDKFKHEYIIALLDRKYATIDEISRFAELEMLGDAVYDITVEQLLFYNGNTSKQTLKKEDFACSNSQIEVAKNLGTDKLYISKYISSFCQKFDIMDVYQELSAYDRRNHNYIADSLEMIIGVIYEEFGLNTAINFTEEILKATYTDFDNSKVLTFEEAVNSNIDEKYRSKLFPCLVKDEDYYEFHDCYNNLENTLRKVLVTFCVGTETKNQRKMITQSAYKEINHDYKFSEKVLLFYLYNGLEKTIKVFKNYIINNLK